VELGEVRLTINKELVREVLNKKAKKININTYIYAHENKNLVVRYSDGINIVEYVGEVVDSAKNSPLTSERIKEILGKLGNTPFNAQEFNIYVSDNIFISVGVFHFFYLFFLLLFLIDFL